jgi:hypothetical protein
MGVTGQDHGGDWTVRDEDGLQQFTPLYWHLLHMAAADARVAVMPERKRGKRRPVSRAGHDDTGQEERDG